MASARPIKPFILKTEVFVDKAPRRDFTGAIVMPPNEAGKGSWVISLIRPTKRAPQPTEVTFKRQVAVPNPKLAKQDQEAVREAMSRGMIISANMIADDELDYGNAPVAHQTRRAKSAYARHLLGNFGPAPENAGNNNNNLIAHMGRMGVSKSRPKSKSKSRRQTRKGRKERKTRKNHA